MTAFRNIQKTKRNKNYLVDLYGSSPYPLKELHILSNREKLRGRYQAELCKRFAGLKRKKSNKLEHEDEGGILRPELEMTNVQCKTLRNQYRTSHQEIKAQSTVISSLRLFRENL